MDYQYANINQINSMDYWTLVNMLMNQITPDIRRQILKRLTEMNDQLSGIGIKPQSQSDIVRNTIITTPQKNLNEHIHNSTTELFNYNNFLPPNMSMNPNNLYGVNSYQVMQQPISLSQINSMVQPVCQHQKSTNPKSTNPKSNKINIADILDDICTDEPDELDMKLAKIKKLHTKIIADKKRRKKNEYK